jgi:hypothetical protein
VKPANPFQHLRPLRAFGAPGGGDWRLSTEKMEVERAALCGPRHAHLADYQALRSMHVPSLPAMSGRRRMQMLTD